MKFLILWAIVIIADFMLEFRFEFIWPFWLLLRSVHDSFKYKGLVSRFIFGNWPLLANGCLHPDVPLPEQFRLDGVNSNGSRVNMQISNCSLPLSIVAGILGSVRVHSHNLRSHMFIFYTSPLAVLRRQHIRLGAVRVAHR